GDIPGCAPDEVIALATRMLVVFAPQIPLYGIAVVLYGVLQAHHRFAAPALAPLVSSLVVIVAYLSYLPLGGGGADPAAVPRPAELALSIGTTLGVLSLALTVIGPAARLRLRWRPTLRFPDGVAGQVRRLALAGPIATGACPTLAARAAQGDRAGFAALSAQTTRAVVLVPGLAAGALAGAAAPIAQVFLAQAQTDVLPAEFARAVALFAPGLV